MKTSFRNCRSAAVQLGVTMRYERGDFEGGYCILRDQRLLLINKPSDASAKPPCWPQPCRRSASTTSSSNRRPCVHRRRSRQRSARQSDHDQSGHLRSGQHARRFHEHEAPGRTRRHHCHDRCRPRTDIEAQRARSTPSTRNGASNSRTSSISCSTMYSRRSITRSSPPASSPTVGRAKPRLSRIRT